MRTVLYISAFLIASALSFQSHACDPDTGERQQHVVLSWDGKQIADWSATPGKVQHITLPNGFDLGISLDDPGPEIYEKRAKSDNYVWELVEIRLYDLEQPEAQMLSRTYGGTNSLQGFGARGGANRVEELGDPGILLTLLKPTCLESSTVAAGR